MNYYAGIGSRETPYDVQRMMEKTAGALSEREFVLRSGGATGADAAFERGASPLLVEIYLPWKGFNAHKSWNYKPTDRAFEIARERHPHWSQLTQGGEKLHARNTHIILGLSCEDPVKFVVCWTRNAQGRGGTGQGIRVAHAHGIPIFDLGDPRWMRYAMKDFYSFIDTLIVGDDQFVERDQEEA